MTRPVVRAARAVARERDERCAEVARRVYRVASELRDERDPALPLSIMAPLLTAAELAAPGAAQLAGLDARDEVIVREVAAYLVAGFREMSVMLDAKHLQAWRERQDEAERKLASDDGPAEPRPEGPVA